MASPNGVVERVHGNQRAMVDLQDVVPNLEPGFLGRAAGNYLRDQRLLPTLISFEVEAYLCQSLRSDVERPATAVDHRCRRIQDG
jgi:hypothetical protein